MEKEARRRALDQFYVPGPLLTVQAGSSKDIVCLTDFDGFATIFFHRTKGGRTFCQKTYDLERACPLCEKDIPQTAQAGICVYNATDKRRQVALFGGPKRGPLAKLKTVFDTLGGHTALLTCTRTGEGKETQYDFIPRMVDYQVPEEIEPLSKEEIIAVVEQVTGEREDDAGW